MSNHLTLPGIDVSGHFVSSLGDCSCEFGNVNEQPCGGRGWLFWVWVIFGGVTVRG